MAPVVTTQEDDEEEEIDPTKIMFLEEDDESFSKVREDAPKQQLQQHHYLRSIDSTLQIRQLPSQGLSFQLWPAATTLVTLLDNHRGDPSNSPLASTLAALSNGPDSLKILELGSGTGLVGITAAATLAADVTVTDLPSVIPNLQFNADANAEVVKKSGGGIHVAPLRWGEGDDVEALGRGFDLVLASDVVYYKHLYDPLLDTLRLMLLEGENKEMVFLMAHLRRWKKDSAFFKKARKKFDVEVVHVDSPREGERMGVVVYRFVAKCSNRSL